MPSSFSSSINTMASNFSSLPTLLLLSLTLLLLPATSRPTAGDDRETLEIIIGGGSGRKGNPNPEYQPPCPPPPPPPCPPPPHSPPPQSSPLRSPPPRSPPRPSPPERSPPRRRPPPQRSPPPPRRRPPQPEFENARLKKAFMVIQRLGKKITGGRLDVVKTWKGNDVCRYKGFRCDRLPVEKERTVSAVLFNGFRFEGPELFLEGFMDELDDIVAFHANSNFFRGPIPENIDRQRFFFEMDLSNNKLPGWFPNTVLGAKQLTFLDLRFNNYTGPIPDQIFNQDIISAIYINNNQFTSNLPANLGRTPARFLTFANNQFTGPIPASIGDAKKTMEEIVFFGNQLEGCLPFQIGNLENAVLFDAGKNRLTGPIPLSLGCMAKAELLYLADNLLYGPVPEEICKLPNLGNFTLRNNFFTQVGPACLKLIKKKILDVSNNCIPYLPNQRSIKECAEFAYKPKYCGNDKSFTYIPCKNNYYLHPHVSKPSNNVNYVSPKKTYAAALTPHHL